MPRRQSAPAEPNYIEWLHTQPCAIPWCENTDITAHHAGEHGLMQSPPDWSAIPLCRAHHLHGFGPESAERLGRNFWAWHGIDLNVLIDHHRAAFGANDHRIIHYPAMYLALFSADRSERFLLWRSWHKLVRNPRLVLFLMLNPSLADELNNDRTVARCQAWAGRWGFDGMIVANLFARVSPYPKDLLAGDPTGDPENLRHIARVAGLVDRIVCAWGNSMQKITGPRAEAVLAALAPHRHKLRCFGTNMNGSPMHPLYLPGDASLRPF